jgi:hypothetical protein
MAKTLKSDFAARAITHRFFVTIAVGALLTSPVSASTNTTRSPLSEDLRKYVHPDVQYQRKNLLDDENAWTIWEKAVEPFTRIEHSKARKYIEPGEMGFPLNDAEPWLRENTNTLELLDGGIARGKCRLPYPDQGYHTILPYLGPLISLADTKLLRAKVRMREGQFEKAAQDLTGLLTMSELIANADGGLVHLRYGWTIDRRTTEGIAALLRYPDVSSQVLQQLLSATTFSHDPVETLHDALRCEMECFLMFADEWPDNLTNATETEIVMGVPPKGLKLPRTSEAARTNSFYIWAGAGSFGYHKALLSGHPHALDKPATIGFYSEYLAHLIQAATLPITAQQTNEPYGKFVTCSNELNQFWNSIPTITSNRSHFIHLAGNDLVKARQALAQIDNPVGNQIVLNTVEVMIQHPREKGYLSVVEQTAAWRLERVAMKTLLALRMYWNRSGTLPHELAGLVESGILTEVPVDPYTGSPLQYSKQGKFICSAARDKYSGDRLLKSYGLKFDWNISLPLETKNR